MASAADPRWLITGSLDNTIRIWDLYETAMSAAVFPDHDPDGPMLACADGRLLAAARLDRSVRYFDLSRPGSAGSDRSLYGPKSGVTSLAFSADNEWLAAAAMREALYLWNLTSAEEGDKPFVLSTGDDIVHAILFHATGKHFVVASYRTVRLFWLDDGGPNRENVPLDTGVSSILGCVASRNGRWLVSFGTDHTLRVWNLSLEDPSSSVRVLRGPAAPIVNAAVSPDERWLAAGDAAGVVRIWDLEEGEPAAQENELGAHRALTNRIVFSPDSRFLATGSGYWDNSGGDPRVILWRRLPDRTFRSKELASQMCDTVDLAFSPSSNLLGSASADGTVCLWGDLGMEE